MKLSRFKLVAITAVVLVAVAAATVGSVPALRWRAQVVGAKLAGDLPEVGLVQLIRWMNPNSDVWLGAVPDYGSIPSGVHNRLPDEPAVIARGAQTYQTYCSACHGGEATGGAGPSLVAFVREQSDWMFLATAKWGRSGTAMVAQPLSERQIWEVHTFVRSRARTTLAEQQAGGAPRIDVTIDRLLNAPEHSDEWLMYAGDFAGHRHSKLAQIDKSTVSKLGVVWAAQLRPARRPLSATPIVTGGLMFVSEAPDGVAALNARTGRLVWRFTRSLDGVKLALCCAAFNRGVAVYGGRVYVATLDAALVALDAATGRKLWEVKVGDPAAGYSMTNAPLVVDGHLIVGVAGGELGMRGFVVAYSPETGKELWRLWTIPGPGEKGHETWKGDTWKTGGAPTWTTGVYDPATDIVYWTTGNPWPDLDNRARKGDNLYTNSLLAIERKTGRMLWHFQFTPDDVHDWDATQPLVLTDIVWQGEKIPAVVIANRNAFYYAIDRRNGRFLYAKPFVTQNWNKGFTAEGRPIRDPTSEPTVAGTTVWPWMHGGANWWPPSYDAKRHLHFVPTVDAATIYFKVDQKPRPGEMTMGGSTRLATSQPATVAIKAIDPDDGSIRWTYRLDENDFQMYSRICGLVSTDGGIVFGGYEDRFVALDSDTGKELWRFRPGGMANGGPVTYELDGRQYIAALAGNVVFAFALPEWSQRATETPSAVPAHKGEAAARPRP